MNDESIDVKCEFKDFSIIKSQKTDNIPILDRIDYLYEKRFLDKMERVRYYIDSLQKNKVLEESDIISAFSVINAYSNSDETTPEMNQLISSLVSSYLPVYENEQTYTRNFFTIHYEEGSITQQNLYALALYFNYAKTTLCHTYQFQTPTLEPGESTYQVYINITSNQTYSGLTVPVTISGVTYTFINIYLQNGNAPLSNYTLGTTCHEFMHAVQFQYGAGNVTDYNLHAEMTHFNEAVANSVKVRLVENCGIKTFVDRFQNSPELSLFCSPQSGSYQYRCYGAVLFPLYIEQEYSSFNTIRNIYTEIQSELPATRSASAAIDTVMQANSSSMGDAYSQCAVYNYNIQHFYNYCESNWQTKPKLSNISDTSTTYTLPKLASRYFEVPDNYTGFSVTFSNLDSITNAKLNRITTTNGEITTTSLSIPTQSLTIIYPSQENQITCFLLSNISMTTSMQFVVNVFE